MKKFIKFIITPILSLSLFSCFNDEAAKELTNLEATCKYDKYIVGNSITSSDIKIKAYYSDNTSKKINSGYKVSPSLPYVFSSEDVTNGKEFTVTYTENYVQQTSTFKVNVDFDWCTVTFDKQGHGLNKEVNVIRGNTVETPEDPISPGHTFDGWYKEDTYETKWDFDKDIINNDVTIYAKWITNQYTVTFEPIDPKVEIVSGETQVVDYNTDFRHIEKPEINLPKHYVFIDYYHDKLGNKRFKPLDNITEDTTVYIMTKVNAFEVSFDLCGHGEAIEPQIIQPEKKAVKPTNPSANGYTFVGWYKENTYATKWDFNKPVTDNMTLYAKWELVNYTITYELEGGEQVDNPTSYTIESEDITLKPTSKEGYNFKGWLKGSEIIEVIHKGSFGNLTLTASFEIKTFNITWSAGVGVESISGGAETAEYLTTIGDLKTKGEVATGTPKTGYTLKNDLYKDASGNEAYEDSDTITSEITIYLVAEVNKHTVTWKNYDGSVLETDTDVVFDSHPTYESATPTKPSSAQYSYEFIGWKDGDGNDYNDNYKMPDKDVVFTAQFNETARKYDISFNLNGAPGTAPETQKLEYGSLVDEPTQPTWTGYTFNGWFKE